MQKSAVTPSSQNVDDSIIGMYTTNIYTVSK